MDQKTFIKRIIGKPWINRSISFDAVDCWGLVVMYYRHVLGIEIPTVEGFVQKKQFKSCYSENVHLWEEIKGPITNGLVFTCYKGDIPTHVGVCVGHGKLLHSRGSVENPGKVDIHSIRSIESIYGKITFHKFIGKPNV